MRKLLLLLFFGLVAVVVLSNLSNLRQERPSSETKTPLLRVALVADSHNENDLLSKALAQAEGMGVNFVIGLGDFSNTGTIEELTNAKKVFDQSKLEYFTTAGDHDLWDSRNRGEDPLTNFREIFGKSTQIIDRENVLFVILDNSDIYRGISEEDWGLLTSHLSNLSSLSNLSQNKLRFVFAQKTPFHPESKHVMGSENEAVARQAKRMLAILEEQGDRETEDKKGIEDIGDNEGIRGRAVDGFFSGDLHFFAEFKSPAGTVKMTTIGAVASERNFQGPRFGILTVYGDYSWEVENVEIR